MKNFLKLSSLIKLTNLKKTNQTLIILLIGGFLDFIGISLIVPFLSVLINNESRLVEYFPFFFKNLLLNSNKEDVFLIGLFFFLCFYLFKSIFLIFANYIQYRFIFDVQIRLSEKLFKKYLTKPLSFHIKNNSSFLIRNLTEEIHYFCEGLLLQCMSFFTEITVTLLFLFFLFYINPVSTLIIISFVSIIAILFFLVMKKKINYWGLVRQKSGGSVLNIIKEGFGILKELILYKKIEFFLNKFSKQIILKSKSATIHNCLNSLPRYFFEFFSITAIFLISLIMLKLNYDLTSIFEFIVIFGITCLRLLPASNRIINFFQIYYYHQSVIDKLYCEFDDGNAISKMYISSYELKKINFDKNIILENVFFRYNKDNIILKNSNLKILKNSFNAIVGPSGSGKSTLINLILGLEQPSLGYVKVDDVDIKVNLDSWHSKIGYVPQEVFLLNDTIKKNITFGLDDHEIDTEKLNKTISTVVLDEFIKSLPDGIDTIIGESGADISGGQKQRIGIARALYRQSELLILDESTSSLDDKTEKFFLDDLNKLRGKMTIIFITHKKFILNHFDQVLEIKNQEILKIK